MHSHQQAFVLPFSFTIGQGLGLSSSHASIGSLLPKKALGQANLDCYVNATNGNLIVEDKALLLPNGDQLIHLAYHYNSLDAVTPWSLSATRRIKEGQKNQYIIMIEGDGHEVKYIYDESKHQYIATEGNDGLPFIVEEDDQGITWYDLKSRHCEKFNVATNTVIHVDEAGHETHYEYDNNNELTRIQSNANRYNIKRSEEKIEVYLVKTDTSILLHTYVLDDKRRLKQSITSDDYIIKYVYDKDDKLRKISQTDGSTLRIKYQDNKLSTIQVGNDAANVHRFTYDDKCTSLKEASGTTSVISFNESLQATSFLHDKELTAYQFNSKNQIEVIVYPDGNEQHFQYDELTGLLRTHVDRDGLETVNYYSRSTPPLLVAIAQHDKNTDSNVQQITHYVYQKNVTPALLRYTISPMGHVKEYVYNENGLVESELDYLHDVYEAAHLLDELSLEDMSAWKEKISANNKMPEIAATRYFYNKQGLVECIQQRKDNANDYAETQFEYDQAGHITKKSVKYADNQFKQETYQYNDNHGQTKITVGAASPLSQRTTAAYTNNQVTTVYPNQRQETDTFNSAGGIKEISETVGAQKRMTTYQYYAADNMVMITLPDGRKTFELYDKDHQLEYAISATGIVTQLIRDESCRYQTTLHYTQPIDIATVFPSLQFNQLSKKLASTGIREQLKNALSVVGDKLEDRQSYTFYGPNQEPLIQGVHSQKVGQFYQ